MSAASHALQHTLHHLHFLFLRLDDRIQDRNQFRTDAVPQRILRHGDSSAVMRNHLPDKIAVDAVGGAGVLHLAEQGLQDLLCAGLITAQIFFAVVNGIALAQNRTHVGDAFCLPCDDLQGEILERYMSGVLQNRS